MRGGLGWRGGLKGGGRWKTLMYIGNNYMEQILLETLVVP